MQVWGRSVNQKVWARHEIPPFLGGDLELPGHAMGVFPARRGNSLRPIDDRWLIALHCRKKKCDEARPRCADCRRLNIPCRWANPSSQSESSSPSLGTSIVAVSEPVAFSDIIPSNSPLPLDDPIQLPDITFEQTPYLPITWPCISVNPHLSTDEDKSLFNHYLNTVARALSRSNDQNSNPFLTTLLPIAASSDTVTSVILGLSGCHWRRVYPTIWNCALARQGKGTRSSYDLEQADTY